MQKLIRNLLSLLAVLTAMTAFGQKVAWKSTVEALDDATYRILLEASIPDGSAYKRDTQTNSACPAQQSYY